MKKGILAEATFNMKKPNIKEEAKAFFANVQKVKQEKGIKQLVVLRKQLENDRLKVVIVPASDVPSDTELKKDGFSVSDMVLEDAVNIQGKFMELEFTETVSFVDKQPSTESETTAKIEENVPLELMDFKVLKGRFNSAKEIYEAFKKCFEFELSKGQAKGLLNFFNTGKFNKKTPPSDSDVDKLRILISSLNQTSTQVIEALRQKD